jgi:hypothetical protein
MTRDQFLALVMPDVIECPLPMVMAAANDVMEDFCRRTSCWTEILDPAPTVAGEAFIELDAPSGAVILDLQAVSVGDHPATAKRMKDIALSRSGWASARATRAEHYEFNSVSGVRLWPTPDTGDILVVAIARLAPQMSMTDLPDQVMRSNASAIAAGVKSNLMRKPKKAWTDLQSAVIYGGEYEQGVFEASNNALGAGSTEDVMVKPVRFGGYR